MTLLVFDLDDTLYPEHAFVRSGFRAVGRWLERERGLVGFARAAEGLFDQGHRRTVFDAALAGIGYPATRDLIAHLVDVYRQHTPEIELHADAAWAIARYRRDYPLALLSDGFLDTQRRKLTALGIDQLFDPLVLSDEFGRECWKPSPVPYRAVMERAGVEGADCLYVSDNPVKDFVTARRLGWRTVRVRRVDGIYRDVDVEDALQADLTIETLFELPGVLESPEEGPLIVPQIARDPDR